VGAKQANRRPNLDSATQTRVSTSGIHPISNPLLGSRILLQRYRSSPHPCGTRGYGEVDKSIELKPQEFQLAEQLVETLSMDSKTEQYRDSFRERLRALIEAKKEGETMVPEHKPARAPVIDRMEALKHSLRNTEAQKANKPARQRPAGTEPERRRRLAC